MRYLKLVLSTLVIVMIVSSCNSEEKKTTTREIVIKEDAVSYTVDSVTMNGYIAYDSNNSDKRPIVMVVPEWWGLNDYPKMRARELASLGYIAMAVDMYGNGKITDTPDSAGKLATPFYQDPQMAKARFEAALAKVKSYSQADGSKVAAIGYCFGGAMVLNFARMGEDLDGVVSFHGGLVGTPADKSLLKSKILVCHGAADPFVPAAEVQQFKKQMDSINANYDFKAYEGATHAFTNPKATEVGQKFNIPIAYNAAADSASWNDMKQFLNGIFK